MANNDCLSPDVPILTNFPIRFCDSYSNKAFSALSVRVVNVLYFNKNRNLVLTTDYLN